MAEGTEVFHAKIAATDDASKTLEDIRGKLHRMAHEADHVGHSVAHMHKPHVFEAINEHIDLLHEHFGELNASIGEVGGSITELLPALGALGAVGGLAELFETAEHVAEKFGELSHHAAALGIPVEELHDLNLVARLTDTSVEAMDKSMGKLNKNIAEAAAGKNKDVAALFEHLGISLKDANGHLRSAYDLLPQISNAFMHTTDAAMRTRMAFALTGKGGEEMIPLFIQGADKIEELLAEAHKLGFDFKPYKEGVESYNESMKKLGIVTEAFTDAVGAKLAPVLKPVVDKTVEWVLANREWIATDIAGQVGKLADWLEKLPLDRIGADMEEAGEYAGDFIKAIGGGERVVEGLAAVMALKFGLFLVEPIAQTLKLTAAVGKLTFAVGAELVAAWSKVGGTAKLAAAEEEAATELSVLGGGHGGGRSAAGAVGAASVAGRSMERDARLIRGFTRVAGAVPVLGAAIEIGSTLPPLMNEVLNPDHVVIGDAGLRQHGVSGGNHDYGTGPSGRNIYRPPTTQSDWLSGPLAAASWIRDNSILTGTPPAAAQRVDGSIHTTITVVAGPGVAVSAQSTATGAAAPPVVSTTGQAFADQYPKKSGH